MAEIPRNPGENEQVERDKAIARIQDFLKIDPKDVKSTITDEHRKILENNNMYNFDIDDAKNRLLYDLERIWRDGKQIDPAELEG